LSAVRIDGPDNVGALAGSNSSIQMKCKGRYRSCQGIIWSRVEPPTDSPAVLSVNSAMLKSYDGRYSVDVSADGACVLNIDGLQLSDAGTFTCLDLITGADYQPKMTATVTVSGILCYDLM